MDELKQILQEMLRNKNQNDEVVINDDTDLRNDLRFDSLDLAELTARIEKAFQVDVFEDGLITTIKDIKVKLKLDA